MMWAKTRSTIDNDCSFAKERFIHNPRKKIVSHRGTENTEN